MRWKTKSIWHCEIGTSQRCVYNVDNYFKYCRISVPCFFFSYQKRKQNSYTILYVITGWTDCRAWLQSRYCHRKGNRKLIQLKNTWEWIRWLRSRCTWSTSLSTDTSGIHLQTQKFMHNTSWEWTGVPDQWKIIYRPTQNSVGWRNSGEKQECY